MPKRYNSSSPEPKGSRLRSAITIFLTTAGFAGGFAIAVFYNTALRPLPLTLEGPKSTTEGPSYRTRSYRSVRRTWEESATDGRGGDSLDTPEARARAREARLERIRIDKIMQICTGC